MDNEEKNAGATSGADSSRPRNVDEKLDQLEKDEAGNVVEKKTVEETEEHREDGGAGTDEGGNDKGNEEDEGEIRTGEIQGLSESVQNKVNERIHEINVRRKNAEAELEQTKTELETLKTGLDDSMRETIKRIGLRPEYLTKDEIKKVERYRDLQGYRKWLRQHPDGYEGRGEKDPGITAEGVKEQLTAVEDDLADLTLEARELERRHDKLFLADAETGRKFRLAKEGKGGKKTVTKPPNMSQQSATRRPVVSASQDKKPAFDKGEFEKDGANPAAFRKQYGKLFQ